MFFYPCLLILMNVTCLNVNMENRQLHMFYETDGDQFYSKNNPYAVGAYKKLVNIIEIYVLKNYSEANKKVVLNSNDNLKPIVIVDFGVADGAALLSVLPQLRYNINRVYPGRDLHLTFVDRPENDFEAVFQNIENHKHRAIKGKNIEIAGKSMNTYYFTVAKDFFTQCVVGNTVDLAICNTSVHWLSSRPCPLDELYSNLSSDIAGKKKYAYQAEIDWENFLITRAEELNEGGHLIVLVVGVDDHGRYNGNTRSNTKCVATLMSDQWKNLHKLGMITETEVLQATLQLELRPKSAVLKPFTDVNSSVKGRGLELVHYEQWILESPQYKKFKHDENETIQEYAEQVICSFKSWSYNYLISALDDSRPESQKKELVNMYFDKFTQEVAGVNSKYLYILDYVYHCVVVKKNTRV